MQKIKFLRTTALNHGTIRSPIPGKEAGTVLQKCKQWAAEVGEIKIGDEPTNPTISIQLSGVDTEAILAAASHEDNPGNQMRMMRQILFEELGIDNADQMFLSHAFQWRNTVRTCDVIYGKVRSLPETSLTASNHTWKVIIDYPPHQNNHSVFHAELPLNTCPNQNGKWLPEDQHLNYQ